MRITPTTYLKMLSQLYLRTIYYFHYRTLVWVFRIARFGMVADMASRSVGALFVLWTSQVTIRRVFDAIDAYVL